MAISSITPRRDSLNTYTAGTWTDLAVASAVSSSFKAITIANPTAGAVSVTIRVADSGGTSKATILPTTSFAAGASQVLNLDTLNLVASSKLQVYCSAPGMEFYCSGVDYA